jgi:Coenzyme PQQ synthesis protein D (PqqD)
MQRSDIGCGLVAGSVLRRRDGMLFRSSATGYLLHTGQDVVAVTGAAADVWGQLAEVITLGDLIDRQAAVWNTDRDRAAANLLEILMELQQRQALEVVP